MNGGIDYERFLRGLGQPLYSYEKEDYWAPLSLMPNAERIEAPILVQSGDYLLGLDVLAAFRRLGQVMELHVFAYEPRMDERRVGNACVRPCRTRGSPGR